MFNPDGSHNQLATRSWVDEVATTTLTPLDLPPELILRIASLLEVRDLLAFRGVRLMTIYESNPPQAYRPQTESQVHIQC